MIPFSINNDFSRNRIYSESQNRSVATSATNVLQQFNNKTILINITFLSRNLQNLYYLLL